MYLARSCSPERRRRCAHRRAGRVDVVHEYDATANPAAASECAPDVRSPFGARQPGLACDGPPPGNERSRLDVPPPSELAREPLCRMMAAPERAVAVRRDIGDDIYRRPGHAGNDELGGEGRERAETALLPGADERSYRAAVEDSGTRRGERQPPPGALPATLDRPGGGGSAARTKRRRDRHHEPAAAVAERRPSLPAGDAA